MTPVKKEYRISDYGEIWTWDEYYELYKLMSDEAILYSIWSGYPLCPDMNDEQRDIFREKTRFIYKDHGNVQIW